MKKLLQQKLATLLFFACIGLITKAQNSYNDSLICLEVNGIALSNKIALDGVNVRLFMENEEMELMEVTSVEHHDHSFSFKLQRDSYYTIEISKPGYFTRTVSISTKLPKEVNHKPIFVFEFEVDMPKQTTVVDDYYLDFPIALIDYDAKKGVFVSHGKYTTHIKNKINESNKQPVVNESKKKAK
jgi:hypothetical protein